MSKLNQIIGINFTLYNFFSYYGAPSTGASPTLFYSMPPPGVNALTALNSASMTPQTISAGTRCKVKIFMRIISSLFCSSYCLCLEFTKAFLQYSFLAGFTTAFAAAAAAAAAGAGGGQANLTQGEAFSLFLERFNYLKLLFFETSGAAGTLMTSHQLSAAHQVIENF